VHAVISRGCWTLRLDTCIPAREGRGRDMFLLVTCSSWIHPPLGKWDGCKWGAVSLHGGGTVSLRCNAAALFGECLRPLRWCVGTLQGFISLCSFTQSQPSGHTGGNAWEQNQKKGRVTLQRGLEKNSLQEGTFLDADKVFS